MQPLSIKNILEYIVSACDVAGLGGLSNEAKRNAKADLLRTVPHTEQN